MPYWGKVVGAVAGLATRWPWGVLVGAVLGHQFDRGFAERVAKLRSERAQERLTQLPESFLKPLFQSMGCLAKADGRVSEDEIRAARAMMHRLGLGPARIREAIDWFQAGKDMTFPLLATIRRFRRQSSRRVERRRLFVRLLLETALAKNGLKQRERSLLWTICSELDIGRVEMAQLEAMLRAQQHFRGSPDGARDARNLAAAYHTLGVKQTASNDDIKRAYRRLMNRNHPDKLSGSDADEAAIAAAEQRTRDIRAAWEMVKARRMIR